MASTEEKLDPRIIDAHLHLDHIRAAHPERLAWMRENRYFPVSWAFAGEVGDTPGLSAYLESQRRAICEINEKGLSCRFLTGIHPRNITADLRPEAIRNLLLPHLGDRFCLGIGEIGLETGSAREIEVFEAQLALFRKYRGEGKVCGVHTPRADKEAITHRTLDLLRPYRDMGWRIVVDHCMPYTAGPVLAAGFRAGVTLSPCKAGFEDIRSIVENHRAELSKIMLNTDSGGRFFEDLYRFSRNNALEESIRTLLVRENAAHFYGLS